VKKSGSFGQPTLEKLQHGFSLYREAGICCAYVTLEERRGYRWAASPQQIGGSCFALGWHRTTDGPIEPTEDWGRLLLFLRQCLATGTAIAEKG
jgi:hypothetical protein